MVRELHVYGKAVEIGELKERETQHKGLGKMLMEKYIKQKDFRQGILLLQNENRSLINKMETNKQRKMKILQISPFDLPTRKMTLCVEVFNVWY